MSAPLRIVLDEGPGSRPLQPHRRYEMLRSLLAGGYAVTRSAGNGNGAVAPLDESHLLILAERGRDQPGGGAEAEGEAAGARVHFRDIDGLDAPAVVALADRLREETAARSNGGWKPWFPVIDFQRCTNCMQCLSFCLFDVYGVDVEKRIQVKNPDKCKTNCPACSRVCPEVAILFPKYSAAPINGAEVVKEDVDREKMKIDISALLGGDIYSLLRDRHQKAQSRFSKERDESKALKERLRCLKELQQAADIPEEVLMALPSLDEIRIKAERAAAAAQEARLGLDGGGGRESR